MIGQEAGLASDPLASPLVRIALAGALGLFLGLEREWSEKSAGIRTFSLISILGAVFALLGQRTDIAAPLLVVGAVLVIVQGVLLAVQGLIDDDAGGLALTTSMSMLVAYGVGVLVAVGFVTEGVTVAVLSSLLLVLKRELHQFAGGLSREEVRSATEFAVLAFVVFPLLPGEAVPLPEPLGAVSVEPRVVWLMVVTVAGIGIVNYAIVQNYGGRGIAVTGFFGGLASSTAVVGTMLDHVRQRPEASSYAVAAILLADAAMAVRNLVIAIAFSAPDVLVGAVVPLVAVAAGALAIAFVTADWGETVEMTLESPFSLRNALAFGGVFLVVVVVGSLAEASFGRLGFYLTAAATGLVSSAGATTSAVALYRTGSLSAGAAVFAILLATGSSIVVKALLAGLGGRADRTFARDVGVWSAALLVVAGVVTVLLL